MVFIINGTARSGKNTFVKLVDKISPNRVRDISSVDKVKEAAYILGWDGKKNEKGRQFLSDLKDMSTSLYSGPLDYMLETAKLSIDATLFFHIREPDEIEVFKNECKKIGLSPFTILLKRPGVTQFTNHADKNVENYHYDFTIINDGTLMDLYKEAELWWRSLQI